MADEEVGSVKFGVKAEFDDKGLKDADKALGALGKSAGGTQTSLTGLGTAGSVAAGILGAEFVKAVGTAIKEVVLFGFKVAESSAKAVEEMEILSNQVGFTLQEFQALEPAFKRTGVSMQAMGSTFRILSQRMKEARDPSSEASRNFQDLGVQLSGLETPSQVLTLIADRISKLPKGFEKTRLESELLGKSGTQLDGILRLGAEGLERVAREAHKMGNVLSIEANQALLDLDDTFDDVDTSVQNFEKHVGVLFAPMVSGFNQVKIAALDLAVTLTDELTVATRTLFVRWQALSNFLDLAFDKNVNKNFQNTAEIWAEVTKHVDENIAKIREHGVVSKDLDSTLGKVDEKAQALARSQAAAAVAATNGLIQVDTGWKIAQAAIDLYDATQKATFEDGLTLSKLFAEQGLADVRARIDGEQAIQDAFQATVLAGLRARQASGAISPTQFASASAVESVAAIDRQISAVRSLAEAEAVAFGQRSQQIAQQIQRENELASQHVRRGQNAMTVEAQRASAVSKLTTEQIALNEKAAGAQAVSTAKITALEQQRVSVSIAGSAAISQAFIQEQQVRDQAARSLADSELRIAQATFQDTATLRQLRLNQINIALAQELAIVGRTEEQKTALIRAAEADRMAIVQQFPTFFQKQMQDLVAGNAFSLSQISTNFTNATAQWIVTGQNFSAFWQQLQITLVQASLNGLIQMGANLAMKAAEQIGITTAMETAKTATTSTSEAARVGIVKAANVAIAASTTATIGSMLAVGQAALTIMQVAMTTAAAMLAAIATALTAGIYTAVLAPPVAAAAIGLTAASIGLFAGGTAALAAAGAASVAAVAGAVGFAKGGITMGPAIFGEAGPEAAIPLNQRGADFMNQMLGTGGSKSQVISINIDGVAWRRWVLRGIPDEVRLRAGAIA